MSELEDTLENLEICRLCLKLTVVKISLFTEDFAKMIEILTSLKIKANDGLPQVSCLKCARDVKSAFLVRRRILQSHRSIINKLKRSNGLNLTRMNTNLTRTDGDTISDQFEDGATSTVETENDNSCFEDEGDNQDDADDSLDGEPVNANLKIDKIIVDTLEPSNLTKHVSFHSDLLSQNIKKIQDAKLSINLKYSDILNNCKQKLFAWKLMNKNDQADVIKWMNRKDLGTKALSEKSKLTPPTHQRKSRETVKMYCTVCQLKFGSKIAYRNHMNKHRHKACPVCNKQIRTVYLKKHMLIHEESPAICEVCGITCKNPVSLRMHNFYYHKSNESVCEDCGKSFRTKTKLVYHQKKDHAKERNHKCETCGKCFFTRLYLKKHFNMKHMKLRPEICEYCGKAFSGKHALRTHIRQHTNEAPFRCDLCGEGFRQRVSLRGHLKSRHKIEEENKVFCDTCGKGFATEMALDVHARLHNEIKCSFCSDTFADHAYLEQHVATAHMAMETAEGNTQEVGWMNNM